jgi:glycosyltransferase involved in cell wall biosynthesis
MIRDEIDGLLCPARDPKALADAIFRLAVSESRRRQMADNAFSRVVAEFSFERRMERVLDLYRRVLSDG